MSTHMEPLTILCPAGHVFEHSNTLELTYVIPGDIMCLELSCSVLCWIFLFVLANLLSVCVGSCSVLVVVLC